MRRKIAIAAVILVTLIQVGIVIALNVIDDMSRKSAGVNHHLMVRKSYYEYWILTEENKKIMLWIAWAILVFTAVVIITLLIKKLWLRYLWMTADLIISAAICGILIYEFISETFQEKLFFPYAIFGTFVIYLLELAKLPVTKRLGGRRGSGQKYRN